MTRSKVTTERLKEIIFGKENFMSLAEGVEIAKEMLAEREAQSVPVGYTSKANMINATNWSLEPFSKDRAVFRHPIALYTAPPAPAVPAGFKLVPIDLTAENGAKSSLIGEFTEVKYINCPECFGGDECESCDGSGRIKVEVPVTWTTIKAIWKKGIEHFDSLAAAPTPTK